MHHFVERENQSVHPMPSLCEYFPPTVRFMEVLSRTSWQQQQLQHHDAVYQKIGAYLEQRSAQGRDAVTDFLFEYYSFRPSLLARWSPGILVFLEETSPEEVHPTASWFVENGGIRLNSTLPQKRIQPLKWIIGMLEQTETRPPRLGCMGLHEWAMVYKTTPRHNAIPLRLPAAEVEMVVERFPIRCTHFDAFRFFSEPAKPLNQFQPTREHFDRFEQPGCLHTNMDLYKWAYKFYPFVPSTLLWDCFLLAWDVRQLDMQASPYDLRSRGMEPVCIETVEGQQEYLRRQEGFFERGKPLRRRLITVLTSLLDAQEAQTGG
jgi:hypothetical protein